jgi:thiol-disulfide isomerase/thioredoxin
MTTLAGRPAGPLALLSLLLLLAAATACRREGPPIPTDAAKIRHDQLAVDALKALDAGRPADAIPLLREQTALAPDAPDPLYNLACAEARAGRAADALASLAKAVDAGWTAAEHTGQDPDLESLRGRSAFQALLARMERGAAAERAFWEASRYAPRPSSSAPEFASYAELDRNFVVAESRLRDDGWKRSPLAQEKASRALQNERIAAIERYLADHPKAADREAAASGLVAAILGLREEYPWDRRSAAETDALIAAADRYDAEFPHGSSRASVAFGRALAHWYARTPPAPEGESRALATAEQFARSDADFAAVEGLDPQGPVGGRAAAMRLLLAAWAAGPDSAVVTDAMRARYAELQPRLDDPEVKRFAREHASDVLFLFKDLSAFRGVDLSGRTWDLAAMKGKVTLIDFWATWCGPCVGEFPALKKLHAEFGPRGFQIVGVSLDGDDRRAFEAWLAKNGAAWPQIYDGKGWETPLAQEFGVRGIPFTVLLDREGRILAVDPGTERVRELLRQVLG